MGMAFDPADLASIQVTPETVPTTPAEIAACLASWEWRIYSGQLYQIRTKEADDDFGQIRPFIPNDAQRAFLGNLWNRNIILKARQLGFSTLIEIMALDHVLWNSNQNAVVIAHTRDAAEGLFNDKVALAYDNLPPWVQALRPVTKKTASQIWFTNGSRITVTTSARSETVQFLHVSEMGKVSANFPKKSREIITGSLQAVPRDGFAVIESTAEGMGGDFHQLSETARKAKEAGETLGQLDWRFHFFPWHQAAEYADEGETTRLSATEHEYFDRVEDEMDTTIHLAQRRWYVAKRDRDFGADPHAMLREYPSTPAEAWQASTEGKYLASVMARARAEGRICDFPILRHVPVNSFWDLGASDDTVVWLHQRVGAEDRWIGYREASGAGYLEDIVWMERHGYLWGAHYLPHDAEHQHKGITDTRSPVAQLREMRPSWDWRVVPRVGSIQHGIDMLRMAFPAYRFHATNCKEAIPHLDAYSREWNSRLQVWHDYPRHDDHSHCPDALRQHAQAFDLPHDPASPTRRASRGRRSTSLTA